MSEQISEDGEEEEVYIPPIKTGSIVFRFPCGKFDQGY